ncbi:hypothetical protein TNCV_840901 [Trichonephila clavipes]|nr:hypothetical protein TNCV_840901 [Trichonephila clavipes]
MVGSVINPKPLEDWATFPRLSKKRKPCREAMHVKSVKRSNVLPEIALSGSPSSWVRTSLSLDEALGCEATVSDSPSVPISPPEGLYFVPPLCGLLSPTLLA